VSFVFHYNDYFWPLVMTTNDDVRTLPLGVALLREQGTGMRWHIVMAANVILSLPSCSCLQPPSDTWYACRWTRMSVLELDDDEAM